MEGVGRRRGGGRRRVEEEEEEGRRRRVRRAASRLQDFASPARFFPIDVGLSLAAGPKPGDWRWIRTRVMAA